MRYQKGILIICCWLSITSSYADLRDPTRPEGYAETTTVIDTSSLVLNSIIISPQRRIAVISGQVVQVGDDIAGAKVVSIERNSVELQSSDSRMTLFLLSTPVKRRSE